jgi:hypothetical protein
MRTNQWQKLSSSFDNPNFSDPNNTATRPLRIRSRNIGAASTKSCKGCFNSRFPTDVVPTTSVQSATAPAMAANSFAPAITAPAPTADCASRHAFPNGSTHRNSAAPKLLIARATAPRFSGFRVLTSTTTKFSNFPLTPRSLCHPCTSGNAPPAAQNNQQSAISKRPASIGQGENV